MRNIRKMIFIFIFAFMFTPLSTHASLVQKTICTDEGSYSVKYDDSVNTEVAKKSTSDFTLNVLQRGYFGDNPNDVKNKFNVSQLNSKCYTTNSGKVGYCPSSSDIQLTDVVSKYLENDKPNSNITIAFSESSANFNITVKDMFNDKLYVRAVIDEEGLNENDASASNYSGQFLSRDGGSYHIYGVGPAKIVSLEFYLKDSNSCNGTFLGRISFITESLNNVEVTNPVINSATCNAVKSYKPSGMKDKEDLAKLQSTKESVVSECYSQKIKYGELDGISSRVANQYEALKRLWSVYNNANSANGSVCTDTYRQTKVSYASSGSYWAMVCTETYTANGSSPKLVPAGGGFEYQANYTVTRTCNITQIAQAHKKPQCNCKMNCVGSWTQSNGIGSGEPGGGPNEDFDACISTCDGGKYSQKCINSCYTKVYGNSRDISFMDVVDYNVKKVAATVVEIDPANVFGQLANNPYITNVQPGSWITSNGNQRYGYTFTVRDPAHPECKAESHYSVDYCLNHQGTVVCTESIEPGGCSWYPDAEYAAELAKSANELLGYQSYSSKEAIATGNYSYMITDSYLKTGNLEYVYKISSTSDAIYNEDTDKSESMSGLVNIVKSTSNTASQVSSAALGADGGPSPSYNSSLTKKATITVNLPLSYINKITNQPTYKATKNSTTGFIINADKARFDVVNDFKFINYYYTEGERRYYTDTHSNNTNVKFDENGNVSLSRTTPYNIIVTSSGVGEAKFGSNINCYYGVFNKYYGDNCEKYCDPNTEICDCGIQYIFRPIITGQPTKVGDLFPNERNPRYNWSSKAIGKGNELYSTYGGKVDPISYTKWLEEVGREDYLYDESSGEIDYEFILTPKSIKAIKQYNRDIASGGGATDYNKDTNNNYLDYDLECANKNGRSVCLSKFLDDTSILMYSGGHSVTDRHNIAGCNNAKSNGTECDISIK